MEKNREENTTEQSNGKIILIQIYSKCSVCKLPGYCMQAFEKDENKTTPCSPVICADCFVETITQEFHPYSSSRYYNGKAIDWEMRYFEEP